VIKKWNIWILDIFNIGEIWKRGSETNFRRSAIGKKSFEKFGDIIFTSPNNCFNELLKILPMEIHCHIRIFEWQRDGSEIAIEIKDLPVS
jgi:hypothetical protein